MLELKPLHVLQYRGDRGSQRGEDEGEEEHEAYRHGYAEQVRGPKARKKGEAEHHEPLEDGHRRPAQGPSDHDDEARHRGHEGFLEKPELLVPDYLHSVEDGGEEHGHGYDAGHEELNIVALARGAEDRAEAVA